MPSKKELAGIFLLFLVWRGFLFLVAVAAPQFLSYQPTFPYANQFPLTGLPQWLYSFANFDGVHYLTIISRGYKGAALIQAFFPAYPLLVKFIPLHSQTIITGLIWSNIFTFLTLILLFWLGKQVLKKSSTKEIWSLLLIFLLFPTSFFLGSFYSESLFLFFVLGSFLAANYKKWWLAGLFAIGASASRVVGIILVPALLLEFLLPQLSGNNLLSSLSTRAKKNYFLEQLKNKVSKKSILPIIFIFSGSAGLLAFMYFLWKEFSDSLYFFHVQAEFGSGRQEALISYPQVVFRYIKILLTYRPIGLNYLIFIQEFIAGTIGLILILWAGKKLYISHTLFALGVFFIPTLTGTFSSMPRYLLVAWPIFFAILELTKDKKSRFIFLFFSSLILIFNVILFIQGHWVA